MVFQKGYDLVEGKISARCFGEHLQPGSPLLQRFTETRELNLKKEKSLRFNPSAGGLSYWLLRFLTAVIAAACRDACGQLF